MQQVPPKHWFFLSSYTASPPGTVIVLTLIATRISNFVRSESANECNGVTTN